MKKSFRKIFLNPLVSIIIPVREISDYLRQETIPALLKQSYQNLEIIILPDKKTKEKLARTRIISTWPKTGPADKRDLGAKKARGEILAFIDDDSYPSKNWLKQAVKVFKESKEIAGVCGPMITPPKDNFRQKTAGYVWSSPFGSEGAGTYRYAAKPRRQVDDFPTANLLIKRKYFFQAGGFDTHFWSGEDTKLCLYLTKKLKKKIIYHPRVLVYHHRREVFGPHLEQISRYALHRGHFARILPQTSLRLGYLAPSLFALGVLAAPILAIFFACLRPFYLTAVGAYALGLVWTTLIVYWRERDINMALMIGPAIFLTHFVYGIVFIVGFFAPYLSQ